MAQKKNTPPKKARSTAIAPEPAQTDYPVRPGSQGPDKPLDNQMIHAWDPANPALFDSRSDPGNGDLELVAEGAGLEAAIQSDDFQRISPEEFDEFDPLGDALDEGLGFPPEPSGSPQLRLLPSDEENGYGAPGVSLTGGENPVDLIEADEPSAAPAGPDGADSETGVPIFEDHGMAAGHYIPDDELPPDEPAEEPAPSEPPAPAPQPAAEQPVFVADLFFPPGPTIELHPAPSPVGSQPADRGLVEKEITDDRVNKMMYRAEMARRRINDEIDSIELAREMLELIRSATTLILSGKDKYEEAERSLNEVEFRLSYSRRVKVWSDAIAYRLLAYEVFWLLALGLGALFIPSFLSAMITDLNTFSPNSLPDFIQSEDLFLGVSTALWGGLGGVVGAMYALWRHVSLKQDFNPQHKMWYYTQPVMGVPIGVVVFLLVRIGIGFTVEGVEFSSPYAIYMLAWVGGFQQTILYEIIRQMLKIFRIPT